MSRKTHVERELSLKPTSAKPTSAKPTSAKPLRTVPFEKGFHFYTRLGNYTGITATSISEFAAKLQVIPTESVIFHSQRKDFQNWIRYTIKDATLAERLGKTKLEQSAEDLRKEILGIVKAHTMHSF